MAVVMSETLASLRIVILLPLDNITLTSKHLVLDVDFGSLEVISKVSLVSNEAGKHTLNHL
jgi:hypothetical protein